MSPTVFLSHASEDKDRFVVDFATKLRNKGIEVWLDKWEILPGDSLVDKIFEEGIKNAQAVIVVVSKHSVHKPWVREELNAAIVRKINGISKLIPVVIDDCEVPEALRSTVWVKISDLNSFNTELDNIVRAIYEHRERPPIGKPPAYASTVLDIIPNLTMIDSLVLKLACERAIRSEIGFVGDMDILFEDAKIFDIPEEEFYESLEILNARNYIEGGKVFDPTNRIHYFNITTFGLEQYARTYIDTYASLAGSVGLQILNFNQRSGLEIAESLNQPFLIIEHVLDLFEANQMICIVKTSGKKRDVHIVSIEAELKRRLREL